MTDKDGFKPLEGLRELPGNVGDGLRAVVPGVEGVFNLFSGSEAEETRGLPMARGFAHSDSNQKHPLVDAIKHGFIVIEADVRLYKGQLVVGHNFEDLEEMRTLEDVYLKPLRKLIEENDGTVYPLAPQMVQLLIDVKTESKSTYQALHKLLEQYSDIFTTFTDNVPEEKALTAIISGNRAKEDMERQRVRYAAYDGRLPDLPKRVSSAFMPMVSDRWGDYFEWVGVGPIPDAEREKLHKIVEIAHSNGQRVRFWNTPEKNPVARRAVWKELLDAGIDYICVDNQATLRAWILENDPHPASPGIPLFATAKLIPAQKKEEYAFLAKSWGRKAIGRLDQLGTDTRYGPIGVFAFQSAKKKVRGAKRKLGL